MNMDIITSEYHYINDILKIDKENILEYEYYNREYKQDITLTLENEYMIII